MGTLSVLEMASETGLLAGYNGTIPPELLDANFFGLPPSVRSDPTVLKSLRAFRPNPHKPKPEDYMKNCYPMNPKQFGNRMLPNSFDCNDNRFITKDNTLAIGSADLEMHFRTTGVKTKKYNDFYRMSVEDLMSINNIPNIANHATVNVVHVNDQNKSEDLRSQNVQSTSSETSMPSTSINRSVEPSNQKAKPTNETQGSHIRKPASSQLISQNQTETSNSVSSPKTILSSVLTRGAPPPRIGVSNLNNLIAAGTGRIITQPQYMAIINRNCLNQTGVQNPSSSTVGIRTAGQNVIAQLNKTPVQPPRANAANQTLTRLLLETDRPNVISNRNYAVQNVQQGRVPAVVAGNQQIPTSPNTSKLTAVRYVADGNAQAVNRTYVAATNKPGNQQNSTKPPNNPAKLIQKASGNSNSPSSPKRSTNNSEVSTTDLTKSASNYPSLILDGRSASPAVTSFENRTFNKSPYSDVVNIMQDLEGN